MHLNTPIFAIIDPADSRVLGDGDCPALYPSRPTDKDIAIVRRRCGCPGAVVIECELVVRDSGAPVLDRASQVFRVIS